VLLQCVEILSLLSGNMYIVHIKEEFGNVPACNAVGSLTGKFTV
jgi:hypothetical protein